MYRLWQEKRISAASDGGKYGACAYAFLLAGVVIRLDL